MTDITQEDIDTANEWRGPSDGRTQMPLEELLARHRKAERTAIVKWLQNNGYPWAAPHIEDGDHLIETGEHLK